MTTILCIIFFFSGASALIFEMLWFQLAGLTFGNGVWAASIVLSSFMGGLAIGNGFAAFKGYKVKRPILLYAFLEILIAFSGFALILVFPKLTKIFVPLFRIFLDETAFLNFLRAIIAFSLMLFPATAMGATLPILVKALYRENRNFGKVLGKLYGWNTLGAVAGVLANELFFVKLLGITGAGGLAAVFNLFAASIAILLYKRQLKKAMPPCIDEEKSPIILDSESKYIRLLSASFIAGFILLALEVIWFRFIILFFNPNSLNFGVMLSTVLLGISSGGFLASKWFQFRSKAHIALSPILFFNGILIIILYRNWRLAFDINISQKEYLSILWVSLYFIFPVTFTSGIIFTMLGNALHTEIKVEIKATGLLTLADTIGGMLGSFVGGFILIPYIGVEKSFFLLVLMYFGIGFLLFDVTKFTQAKSRINFSLAMPLLALVSILFFPFGLMNQEFLEIPCIRFKGERRVAVLEGLTETVQYLQKDLLGEPYYNRLITNTHVMSGTLLNFKRYMKFFVYLPVAVNPDIKNALLICFGCGITAKALAETSSLERIEIVEISKDIIDLSKVVFPFPNENPVNDPRVKIHIEDGRFFLLTTKNKFDLITAEPPPPSLKGVVNLYTQEYFQSIYDCLSDGGIVTYWLPVSQIEVSQTKSILKGFCNVFKYTSLWSASGFEWMMVGIKNPKKQVTETEFSHQWTDPIVGAEMRALGLESAEQFGSLFIGDGQRLQNWISNDLPLVDNYPYRLYGGTSDQDISYSYSSLSEYRSFKNPEDSKVNFMDSEIIKEIWPDILRKRSEKYFSVREDIDEMLTPEIKRKVSHVVILHDCIHNPLLKNYILWAFFSDKYGQDIISKVLKDRLLKEPITNMESPDIYLHLASRAAQRGDYLLAEQYLDLSNVQDFLVYSYRIYLLFISGKKEQALTLLEEYMNFENESKRKKEAIDYWNWLVKTVKPIHQKH